MPTKRIHHNKQIYNAMNYIQTIACGSDGLGPLLCPGGCPDRARNWGIQPRLTGWGGAEYAMITHVEYIEYSIVLPP
jgi:hypothetical protein